MWFKVFVLLRFPISVRLIIGFGSLLAAAGSGVFGALFSVGLVWTLPNAVILYSQRWKFTEPAKEKPGF